MTNEAFKRYPDGGQGPLWVMNRDRASKSPEVSRLGAVEASLTHYGILYERDGGLQMHISSAVPVTASQLSSSGKSKVVPPGLAGRGLDLPPGIAKKLEAGGIAPAGIAKRFPAATAQVGTPIPDTTGTAAGDTAPPPDGSQVNVSPVDILV